MRIGLTICEIECNFFYKIFFGIINKCVFPMDDHQDDDRDIMDSYKSTWTSKSFPPIMIETLWIHHACWLQHLMICSKIRPSLLDLSLSSRINESLRTMYSLIRKIPNLGFLLEFLGSQDEGTHLLVEVAIWVHNSFYGLIKDLRVIPYHPLTHGPLSS